MPPQPIGRPRRPRGPHSAGCLGAEVEVTYRFHPLCGSVGLVVCDQLHNGVRHFTLRTAGETTSLVPAWMTGEAGRSFQIVELPRLPVGRLLEMRTLADTLLASCTGDSKPSAGGDHGETDTHTTRPIRASASTNADPGTGAAGSCGTTQDPAGRGGCGSVEAGPYRLQGDGR
jgi:hypothetical protein